MPFQYNNHGTTFFLQLPPQPAFTVQDHVLCEEFFPLTTPPPPPRPKKILTITPPPKKKEKSPSSVPQIPTPEKKSTVMEEKSVPTTLVERLLSHQHPLRFSWCLWYFKLDKQKRWEDCFFPLATVSSVEEFYGTYLHIVKPTELSMGNDYYMFKENIKPMWEDEANANGGRWLISVDRQRAGILNEYWENLLNAMIGNRFGAQEGDFISGAVVNLRNKGHKLSLWTKESTRNQTNEAIGHVMKKELSIDFPIRYEAHQDVKDRAGSVARAIITL